MWRHKALVVFCVLIGFLAGCSSVHVTGSWVGGSTDTIKPGIKFTHAGGDNWDFSFQMIGEHPQIAIVKRFGFGPVDLKAGPSYLVTQDLEPVQCSQLNMRTGIEYKRVFLEHDSNGSLCWPNPGINTVGFQVYQEK